MARASIVEWRLVLLMCGAGAMGYTEHAVGRGRNVRLSASYEPSHCLLPARPGGPAVLSAR